MRFLIENTNYSQLKTQSVSVHSHGTRTSKNSHEKLTRQTNEDSIMS